MEVCCYGYILLSCVMHRPIIMPPPRGHNAVIGVRRPSVRLMSRTSALTRKPKGLGRRNFVQGYPRSHATLTPTSRSKGQKSRSRGSGILWRPPSRTAAAAERQHQQSCHLANGCRYNVIKILLNIAMLIIIHSNHFRVNSAV